VWVLLFAAGLIWFSPRPGRRAAAGGGGH